MRSARDILDRFSELSDKAGRCNNVAVLQNIKIEADALKVRCLNEIVAEEGKLQAKKIEEKARRQKEQNSHTGRVMEGPASYIVQNPVPKVKKQKIVSIKSINTETTWQLETSADVKRYIAELEMKLMAQLADDTIVHIEF